jgi:hypothetical protein
LHYFHQIFGWFNFPPLEGCLKGGVVFPSKGGKFIVRLPCLAVIVRFFAGAVKGVDRGRFTAPATSREDFQFRDGLWRGIFCASYGVLAGAFERPKP